MGKSAIGIVLFEFIGCIEGTQTQACRMSLGGRHSLVGWEEVLLHCNVLLPILLPSSLWRQRRGHWLEMVKSGHHLVAVSILLTATIAAATTISDKGCFVTFASRQSDLVLQSAL
jgi:hypothetical protein